MESIASIANQYSAENANRPQSGAKGLDRGLRVVAALLILGWFIALLSLLAYVHISRELIDSLVASLYPDITLPIIVICAFIFPLLVVLIWRWRVKRNPDNAKYSGCVQCNNKELARIKRYRFERAASKLVALPIRRYKCYLCGWEGILVDSHRKLKISTVSYSAYDLWAQDDRSEMVTSAQKTVPIDNALPVVFGPMDVIGSFPARSPNVVSVQALNSKVWARVSMDFGAIVTAPFGLKLRKEPRNDAEILKVLPLDSHVELVEQEEEMQITAWHKVAFEDVTGWVSSAFLKRLPDCG